MSTNEEPLNKRLKRLREARGMSVKELARAIEVPESTYREWEYGRGLRVPPFEKIASTLMISTTELLTGRSSDFQKLHEELENLEKELHRIRQNLSSII
ncbi:MAG TPA: helix-turn-helix transcriptional regulator [Bdellovibrio sp.]|nr:helix-turn-helix transcriptional regulator [Bdellovibrio sp.]